MVRHGRSSILDFREAKVDERRPPDPGVGPHLDTVNAFRDVDVKDVGDDKKVANFLLAVDRPGQDSGADFVRVSTWNRQAETCAEFLAKGARVAIDGRLRSRSWEEEGKRRSAIEVVANRVQFLDSRREAESPFGAATAS